MANVDIKLGYKGSAWFTANAAIILKIGQIVYLEQTGTYKIGDGATALSALSFLGGSSTTPTLQEVVTESPIINDPITSLDGQTSVSISNLNLNLITDGFLTLEGATVTKNGVEIATVNDLPISFLDCVNGATTVTTANTLSTSLLVLANTFIVNDLIEFKSRGVKNGANGTFTIRIYVNSSNTISGSTLLGSFNSSSNGNTQLTINRIAPIKSTTSTQVISSSANLGDDFIQTTISSINIDHTINQYYIVALQCGSAVDSAVCSYFKITKN